MKRIIFAIAILGIAVFLPAQNDEKVHKHPDDHSHLRMSATLAHTYLPEHTVDGKANLVLPSFGLDIEYWMNHTWGIGLHNDLELLNFEVKNNHDEIIIEREFPVLITLDALWNPANGIVLFTGPGIELESQKNYFVFRAGLEYELPISAHWDVAPIIFYDARKDAYNTFTIGLGIGYHFGKKNH